MNHDRHERDRRFPTARLPPRLGASACLRCLRRRDGVERRRPAQIPHGTGDPVDQIWPRAEDDQVGPWISIFRIRSECWRWSGGTSGSHCQRFPGSDQLGLLIVSGHVLLPACAMALPDRHTPEARQSPLETVRATGQRRGRRGSERRSWIRVFFRSSLQWPLTTSDPL